MYFSLADYYKYTTGNIGVYFSDTAITGIPNFFPLPVIPQIVNTTGNTPDTVSWKQVSGNYIAQGGESYLVIGNFNDDAQTDTVLYSTASPVNASYVYIDDVSLTDVTGIKDQEIKAEINFYPNPFTGFLVFENNSNVSSEIVLFDIASRVLVHQKFTGTLTLNTEQFDKGVYLFEIRYGNNLCRNGKVVKY